ncbi:MAG TPA: class IV adenylate cyclase [Amycolatopsis sp.]|nr:class IV adenylate cyclase [Amycolatopsis sp.]
MTVEAELTALLRDPDAVHAALAARPTPEHSVYADTYYDRPDHRMDADDYELRVRVITTGDTRRVLLTYKEPPVPGTRSKPEHETTIGDPDVMASVFAGLGLVVLIAFEKRCTNYRFTDQGRDLLATVVQIPELDGRTFLELETMADPDDVPAALDHVRNVLAGLGVTTDDLTTEPYTSQVAAHRR